MAQQSRSAVLLALGVTLSTMACGGCSSAEPSASGGDAGSSSSSGSTTPTPPGAPELTREVWMDGLSHPWDLAFLPDGSALVSERTGKLSGRRADGTRVDITVFDDVAVVFESGLLGMTLDPDFATNRAVYVCLSSQEPVDNRVLRFTLSPDGGSLSERTEIVTGIPRNENGRHSGCRPRFGADGFLYIGTGDAAISENPQSPQSLGGKVLRVTRDGQPAPGNPDLGGDPRVFTFGHRNVQGLAVQPGTGRMFEAEHGPGVDDEINLLVAGANYGWDPKPGYDEGVPMTDREKFPEAVPAAWSSGNPTRALSGIEFVRGAQWGSYDGFLVGAELKNSRLTFLRVNAAGTEAVLEAEYFADQGTRLRTPVLGPDGALYVTTDGKNGGDEIWRVAPR